ncbi:MAG: hypothetical protein ACHQET_09130 [Chitinophagales bacterium]
MKNLKLFSLLFGVIAISVIGCSKGSAGPAGPPGAPGAGQVTYSSWITLNMTQNVDANNDTFYTQTIAAPAITQKILDSGIVITYLSIIDNNNVLNVVNASAYFLSEIFTPGQIDLTSLSDFSTFQYRYAVIPGSIQGNKIISGPAAGLTKQQLQTMSYEAVRKMLGLPASTGGN